MALRLYYILLFSIYQGIGTSLRQRMQPADNPKFLKNFLYKGKLQVPSSFFRHPFHLYFRLPGLNQTHPGMIKGIGQDMSENTLAEIHELETIFTTDEGVVKAVDKVSFSLEKGRTVGVVGESGSGKSVTSLSLMRLIPNPPGRIVGGRLMYHSRTKGLVDLTKVSEHEMREFRGNEIAMIFQEPMTSLNPVFTCGDQVMEALILHEKMNKKQARARTLELFVEVELPRPENIIESYPHQLSGGQKQRVMIAMAMSCNPRILIADEPTTALDVTVQATILDLMRKLRDSHDMGIIFITHDLGVIAEIADHVVVMYKGKIVEQGSVWEIFSNPQHPYTKGLLACRPPLHHRLKLLPTISDFMEETDSGEMIELKKSVD